MKQMKLNSSRGQRVSEFYHQRGKELGYSSNFYQSLVKDALWRAWSSKWAERRTLVLWNNFGGIETD